MQSFAEAFPAPNGSLATFLTGPVINRDNELSNLVIHAETLRDTPFLVYSFPQQRTLHLADGILSLCGHSAKEICDGGINFVLKITAPEDVGYLTLLQAGY